MASSFFRFLFYGMKFLFVAPRFHTNQYGAVNSLLRNGHDVKFLVSSQGRTECHDQITPVLLPGNLSRNVREYRNILKHYGPDVIIIRGIDLQNTVFASLGRRSTKKIILYTQDPLYRRKKRAGRIIIQKRLLNLISRVRITPVLGSITAQTFSLPHEYFAPFVVEPHRQVEDREYFRDGKVNILSIGKFFLERKNHLLLLDAIDELRRIHPVRLTLIGSLNDEKNPYYMKIRNHIAQRGLENTVTLNINVPHRVCLDQYLLHDLFILPSTDEPAAVSPLEAMAHGLPAICSDTNGTNDYINIGKNGFIFRSNDMDDLKIKIERIVSDRKLLVQMGKESLRLVEHWYSPDRFHSELCRIIQNEFSQ